MVTTDPVAALLAVIAENNRLTEENQTLRLNNQMLAQTMMKLGQAAVELEKQRNDLRTGESVPTSA